MSRVSLTERVPGDPTTAATENANRASFAAALGDIDAVNVRDEGLDYGSFVDGVVESTAVGTKYFISSSTPSAAYTGAYAGGSVVVMGAVNIQVGDTGHGIVVAAGQSLKITASALLQCDKGLSLLCLQSSPDNAAWTTVARTRRRANNVTRFAFFAMNGEYTVIHKHALGAGTWYYRLAVENGGVGNTYIENASLFAQVFAH